jgi:hypothetical protein
MTMGRQVIGRTVLLAAWAAAAAAIVVAAVHPESGVAWDSPLAAASLGAVGLGLCLHARQQHVNALHTQDDEANGGHDE